VNKQLALGSILGAIVLFVWSAIAWNVIPWPGDPLRAFTNEDMVEQAIVANAPKSGNYLLPNPHKAGLTSEQQQKSAEKMFHGPMMFASVRLEPLGSMPKLLVMQFLTQLIVALIATFLLLQTSGLSYGKRVVFVTAIGLLIFVGGKVDQWIWWSFSNAFLVMELGAIVIGWFLASLVIAKFVRGKSSAVTA
jgi:hypothetical protein